MRFGRKEGSDWRSASSARLTGQQWRRLIGDQGALIQSARPGSRRGTTRLAVQFAPFIPQSPSIALLSQNSLPSPPHISTPHLCILSSTMRSCLKQTPPSSPPHPPSPPPPIIAIPPNADEESFVARDQHEHDDGLQLPSPSASNSNAPSTKASPRPTLRRMESMSSSKKSVKFCEQESFQYWTADEWDRSPADVTPRLTYQSVSSLLFLWLFWLGGDREWCCVLRCEVG